MIQDNNNKPIVQIIPNKDLEASETLKFLYNAKMLNFGKSISNKDTKISLNNNSKLKPLLLCLYHFKNLMTDLNNYTNNNNNIITKFFVEFFQNVGNIDIIISKFSLKKIIEKQNFKDIISEIFDKLDLELSNNKKNINDQTEHLTEKVVKEIFDKEHQNRSIIEKTFYFKVLIEKNRNNKTTYICNNQKYLLIDLDKEEKVVTLSEKINNLNNNKEKIKIVSFPKVLIVVIEGKKNDNFYIKGNFNIRKDNQILYKLNSFIERETNFVFHKKEFAWSRNNYNKEDNVIDIETSNIKPILLFYRLIENNNGNNNINKGKI